VLTSERTIPSCPNSTGDFGAARSTARAARTTGIRLEGVQIVTASITKEAVEELGLAVGTAATVLVKSTEVMLAVD